MCLRDPPQPPLDETPAGVAPGEYLGRREALSERCAPRKLAAQRRPELVRVEVEDGELPQPAGRQDAPVAPASRDRELPELAEPVRLGRDVPQPIGYARCVVLA